MRHLWVRYSSDKRQDIVSDTMLDSLLVQGAIAQFYRPSEARWVTVGLDPVRGSGGPYAGPERRSGQGRCPYFRGTDTDQHCRTAG